MAKTITHAQLRNGSSQVLREITADHEPRIVTNHGTPVGVLVPATQEELARAENGLDVVAPAAAPADVEAILSGLTPARALPEGVTTQAILDDVRG